MQILIKETLETVIEAGSLEEVEAMYSRGEIVLDAEDFKCVEFTEYIDK